jgi:predicted lysophospholipase L1 biosynthesis ABC-type transport system permease subunit
VRDSIRPSLPASARIDSSDDPVGRQVLGAASIALWTAALCCLLIALVAVGSASSSRLRWGRNDVASLRAIGMSAREQSTTVLREMALVLSVAAVAGIVAGVLVSVLTVPELARAAVDRAYLSLGAGLSVDWLGLGLLLGALAVGITVILVDLSRRVRKLASTSLPSEGHE